MTPDIKQSKSDFAWYNEEYNLRVSKGEDFIMIDLLPVDRTSKGSFTMDLGAIVMTKKQWKQLKKFIKENPHFEYGLK